MPYTLFFDYHRGKGVDIKVVRIFNTYGPQMDCCDGRVYLILLCRFCKIRILQFMVQGAKRAVFNSSMICLNYTTAFCYNI